jgi:hypothetical protein
MSSAPKPPNLREGESALVVVCPVCAAPRGVKCARERHVVDGLTHSERIAATAAWHTLNAAADRAERRDLDRFPPAERDVQEARAQVWLAAARDLRRATTEEDTTKCPRCGREVLAAATIAAQADALRAAIEGAVALGLTRPGDALADAYGGDPKRALFAALTRAADLALEHARGLACAAGTCTRRGTP